MFGTLRWILGLAFRLSSTRIHFYFYIRLGFYEATLVPPLWSLFLSTLRFIPFVPATVKPSPRVKTKCLP